MVVASRTGADGQEFLPEPFPCSITLKKGMDVNTPYSTRRAQLIMKNGLRVNIRNNCDLHVMLAKNLFPYKQNECVWLKIYSL